MKSKLPNPESKNMMTRRKFVKTTVVTAASISIVPRHVLGGSGYIPPSDKITIANIGCGTQGLREMTRLVENPEVQIVAVCDPNKFSTNYLDWNGGQTTGVFRAAGTSAKRWWRNTMIRTSPLVNIRDASLTRTIGNCSIRKRISMP